MADAHASREANRGTMLQALAGKASSRSRAAIADSTRFANHGPPSSAGATAPNNSSRVASKSCRASRHLLQSAKCARPSPGKLSTSFSILATSTSAAELSSKSCSRSHWSLLRFNRFRMLPPCRSIPALLCQHYHPPSRAEKPHLYGVGIQFQQLRNLFNRKPFHFLQNQHQPVSVLCASGRLENAPPLCRRHCWRAKGRYFWDACHGRLVTAIIPGLPEPAPSVSLPGF